jgi:hypothetical protein
MVLLLRGRGNCSLGLLVGVGGRVMCGIGSWICIDHSRLVFVGKPLRRKDGAYL